MNKSLKVILILAVIFLTGFCIFEVYTSLPYFETDIYQIKEHTQFGEEVITCVISPKKMTSIISNISDEVNFSSMENNFSVKIIYQKGGSNETNTKETFNIYEIVEFVKSRIYEHNQDGLIDIIGNDIGFAIHDKDFFIFYQPKDRDKIIKILTQHGLKEKKYLVKSYYPHLHFITAQNKDAFV